MERDRSRERGEGSAVNVNRIEAILPVAHSKTAGSNGKGDALVEYGGADTNSDRWGKATICHNTNPTLGDRHETGRSVEMVVGRR